MSFKERIIENAWFGFNMDYGLLHVQLATPVFAFCLLMIVMFFMNKWLFQPVFQTLTKRQKVIEDGKAQIAAINVEITTMKQEYEKQLSDAHKEVGETYKTARQTAQGQRDNLLREIRQKGEEELKKGKETLQQEIEVAQSQLKDMTEKFAGLTANTLLN